MDSIDELTKRLDAEFKSADSKVEEFQAKAQRTFEQRQERYQKVPALVERIREMAKARLEALVLKFPDTTVKRSESRYGREVQIYFKSDLASVKMTLGVALDEDIANVALDYHLEILPVFIEFEPHSRYEQPLEGFSIDEATAWLDDRLVAFVKAYLSMQFATAYQKGHLVTDPVAGLTFPEHFTKTTIEHKGQKHHFISEATKQAFAKEHGIGD